MKQKTVFICQECGYTLPKWVGRCPDCGKWNTYVEELNVPSQTSNTHRRMASESQSKPQPVTDIQSIEQERLKSGIEEFDRVLGGGAVPGSVALVGGDPGMGKSTILLQAS
ncbi:DNA repair protein RadA, partial [Candidatus Poribacteria bacterium]|nr:DNA repair protein RadA [Candidatus Poribacteria bacterium]